ncbi:ankyrin repeat-containing domain protein [Ilyonectria robusta]|uniref:ankyrin repeat-containing domain protein n=1 Tax=Ilyonectria robusta TaxID=1079257 RepID=UPI001E8DFD7E|nr:ankyrin repeat-containing domain protein [Ilyonectria robusta]KAH8669313.1 ankyrin repeat-containing domain protein [Ilyonectria robusta]
MELLRGAGFDITAGNFDNVQALNWVIENKHRACVRPLLENYTITREMAKHVHKVLAEAAASGQAETVRLLLEGGANPNGHDAEDSPIDWAIMIGDQEIVRLFLDHGADVKSSRGVSRFSTMHLAVPSGDVKIAQWLIDAGVSYQTADEQGRLPLHHAVGSGHLDLVRLFLDHGCNPNAIDNDGFTPLHTAAQQDQALIAECLIEKGADIDAREALGGSPLKIAAFTRNVEGVVRLGLDDGADIRTPGESRKTLLHFAAGNGHKEVVKLLLDRHADIEARETEFNRTALQMAAENGHEEVLQLLLACGVKTSASGGLYGTALQSAVVEGHSKAALALLDHGADVNGRGGVYGTALQAAAWKHNEELLKMLLDRGADVGIRGGEYGSALGAARAALLEDWGGST